MADPLRALASINGRFAPSLAQTMLAAPRATEDAAAFSAYAKENGFEFTDLWADNNIPFVAPVLRRFAQWKESVDYLEIGAYEGRNLAFMDWLLPGKLAVSVIDPWFDETLNPEEKYHAVEPRFQRNAAKLGFRNLDIHKGFSTYELPRMLEAGRTFDLVYVDGTHTALGDDRPLLLRVHAAHGRADGARRLLASRERNWRTGREAGGRPVLRRLPPLLRARGRLSPGDPAQDSRHPTLERGSRKCEAVSAAVTL